MPDMSKCVMLKKSLYVPEDPTTDTMAGAHTVACQLAPLAELASKMLTSNVNTHQVPFP